VPLTCRFVDAVWSLAGGCNLKYGTVVSEATGTSMFENRLGQLDDPEASYRDQ
jgi:hypothetical protein